LLRFGVAHTRVELTQSDVDKIVEEIEAARRANMGEQNKYSRDGNFCVFVNYPPNHYHFLEAKQRPNTFNEVWQTFSDDYRQELQPKITSFLRRIEDPDESA
jgi:hypothetical protein